MNVDFVVVSSWPNGAYLSKKLSDVSKAVCYIDVRQSPHRPMGIFSKETDEEEKRFIESISHLEKQEGGFCLLNEKGAFHLQEEVSPRFFSENLPRQEDFYSHSARIAATLTAPAFESLHQPLSASGEPDIFADYFLFHPDMRKKARFQSALSNVRWLSAPEGTDLKLKEGRLSLAGESFPMKQVIWLGDKALQTVHPARKRFLQPDWEWVCFNFSADLRGYEDIVPPHFVFINRLLFPWTHGNLLSVFHSGGIFHVWCRKPFHIKAGVEEEKELILDIQTNMQKVFAGVPFRFLKREAGAGLFVYGRESFACLKGHYILQGNLMNQVKGERKIFHEVSGL